MSNGVVQVQYQDLAAISGRFTEQANAQQDLHARLQRCVQALADGGWEGRSADAFFAEMNSAIFPALQRLIAVLHDSSGTTLAIIELMQSAETEAAELFQDTQPLILAIGRHPFAISTVVSSDERSLGSILGSGALVGLGSVLGPMPVPIFGPHGLVPTGYPSGAGRRLWLYIGGAGNDTIFSIHPHSGWGRAPKFDQHLAKPFLRFDYGTMTKGQLPNGSQITLTKGPNFFHWNQKGGVHSNNSLWRTIGGQVSQNHQMLSNTPTPRSNTIGPISGGKLVRWGSRGLLVAGMFMDGYNIATADNKIRETTRVAGGWAGSWAGAKAGAAIGATIGSCFGPGPGTAIGGVIGGVIGGIGGYAAGYELGSKAYDGVAGAP